MAEFSKSGLDRLGERLRASVRPADDDRATYDAYRASFATAVVEVERLCDQDLSYLRGRTARLKTMESVIAKLRRGSFRLSQVQDIAGVRVAVVYLSEQNILVELLRRQFPEARITDYRDAHQNGYRAVHVIVTASDGNLVEIQVRTEIQDIWANTCESLAGLVDLSVKYGGGPGWIQSELVRLAEIGREFDAAIEAGAVLVRAIETAGSRFLSFSGSSEWEYARNEVLDDIAEARSKTAADKREFSEAFVALTGALVGRAEAEKAN